jgi:glycosyltransferase involved in cell wall biosynthesis
VGRVTYPQKRADLLIDIWKQLYQQFPDWHLDVVGEGALRKVLEQKAKEEGIERIIFHGQQDPRPFYEKAKFFCMTSAFEGYGMVLAEAQAYGVVPIAFDAFSVLSEIVSDKENGVMIPPFEVDEYARQLGLLMNDENRRKSMAKNGRRSITKFNPQVIAAQWIKLFNESKAGDPLNQ